MKNGTCFVIDFIFDLHVRQKKVYTVISSIDFKICCIAQDSPKLLASRNTNCIDLFLLLLVYVGIDVRIRSKSKSISTKGALFIHILTPLCTYTIYIRVPVGTTSLVETISSLWIWSDKLSDLS